MHDVRLAVMAGFPELVNELHSDLGAILKEVGLSPTFFTEHSGDDVISYEQIEQLLQSAATHSGCPHIGALLGSKQDINLLGVIGYVMQQSDDVGSALNELCQHFSLQVEEAATVEVVVEGDFAFLIYTTRGEIKCARQTNELALSEGMIILKAVCGAGWKPHSVNFTHKAPDNIQIYPKIFKVPVYFNQEKTQIVFPKNYLKQPIYQADPVLKKILQTHIGQLKHHLDTDLCSQVETIIRRTLPTGNCTIDNVASIMAVHRRTLHRMLKEQNSSFTDLLEKVRKSIASERLENSDISIIQLSDYLGYADNTAFTRAFKRWYGVTPMQWKKSQS